MFSNTLKKSGKKSCLLSIRNFLSFRSLKEEEDFIDVTLSCEERQYSAHKVVLSACSPYFRKLLKVTAPILVPAYGDCSNHCSAHSLPTAA